MNILIVWSVLPYPLLLMPDPCLYHPALSIYHCCLFLLFSPWRDEATVIQTVKMEQIDGQRRSVLLSRGLLQAGAGNGAIMGF